LNLARARRETRRGVRASSLGDLAATIASSWLAPGSRAQAYVRDLLPNGLELLFCAHHNRQHSSALTIAVGIHDESYRLARPAA
jgi:hypothetical protein